jgi:isochorismate hydrolase
MNDKIIIDSNSINLVNPYSPNKKDLLIRYLEQDSDFASFLESYITNEVDTQGTCQLIDCTIYPETFLLTNNTGSFMVDIYYQLYFGCSDMNRNANHDLELKFIIDLNDNSITFEYEDLPQRDPDTY